MLQSVLTEISYEWKDTWYTGQLLNTEANEGKKVSKVKRESQLRKYQAEEESKRALVRIREDEGRKEET